MKPQKLMYKKKEQQINNIVLLFVLFYLPICAVAEDILFPAVKTLAETAFTHEDPSEVKAVFEKKLAVFQHRTEQCQALGLLADYEERIGRYNDAAFHYRQAANLCSDNRIAVLLKAVRAFLCGGEYNQARSLLTELHILLCEDETDVQYRTAAVYAVWLLLAEDYSLRALPLIRTYIAKNTFADYHPALLFTLWWVASDAEAKNRLLREFPKSIEAAAVQGRIIITPSAFWYLMPKTSKISHLSPESKKIAQGEKIRKKPLYYQLGFYRVKKYAEALAAELEKKKFVPILKEETRQSGTTYFAVLVKENTAGDMGLQLRDAGYEAVPIFQ